MVQYIMYICVVIQPHVHQWCVHPAHTGLESSNLMYISDVCTLLIQVWSHPTSVHQ